MIIYNVKHLQLRLFFLLVFHIKFEREGENKNHNVLQTSISWMSTVFSVHLAHHHVTAALCIQHDVKIGVWTSSAYLFGGFFFFFFFFLQHPSLSPSSPLGWTTYPCRLFIPLSISVHSGLFPWCPHYHCWRAVFISREKSLLRR